MIQTVAEAHELLQNLGASAKLLLHLQLVGEAAGMLISKLHELQIVFDEQFVRLGVAVHDAGKILYPLELKTTGHQHEGSGEQLLIEQDIDKKIARCCRSHGQWQTLDCSLEELIIALADKLWKGKREALLEEKVIQQIASQFHGDYWTLFIELDSCFEAIASDGHSRLLRSQEKLDLLQDP